MSKRLRATGRSGKLGRSLRPRSGQRPSFTPDEQLVEAPVADAAGAEEQAPASAPRPAPEDAGVAIAAPAAPPAAEAPAEAPASSSTFGAPGRLTAPSAPNPTSGILPPPSAHEVELPASLREPPISSRRLGELLDPSSVSAEFFRRDEDSLPPLVDSSPELDHDEPAEAAPISAATIARRARFRRVVGAVVAFAGVVALAAVGKALVGSKPSPQAPVAAMTAPAPKAPEAKPAPAPEPAPPPAAKPAEPQPAPAEPAAAAAPQPEEKAEEKTQAPSAASPEDVAKLKKDALGLLNRGKYKEAIETARAAIAADPTDAIPYLYLGSALQDTGKWKDGIDVYSECVRTAKKGPVHECSAMGGRK